MELVKHNPVNTGRATNVGVMWTRRRRRWSSIKPAVVQRVSFAGLYISCFCDNPFLTSDVYIRQGTHLEIV